MMSSNPRKALPAAMVSACKTPYLVKPISWTEYLSFVRDLHLVVRDGSGQ
jgi:hypothetical protein